MVRSFWMGPPVVALTLAAAAWGQPPTVPYDSTRGRRPSAATTPAQAPAHASAPAPLPPPVPAGQSGERIITVQEGGKSGQPCRILRSWQQAGGARVYQAQSLQTGEMLTIVESGPLAMPAAPGRPRVRAVATTIYHWGRSKRPPAGSPVPPGVPEIQTVQMTAPAAIPVVEQVQPTEMYFPMSESPPNEVFATVEPRRPLLERLFGRRNPRPIETIVSGPPLELPPSFGVAERMPPGDTHFELSSPPQTHVAAVVEEKKPIWSSLSGKNDAIPAGTIVSGPELMPTLPVAERMEEAAPARKSKPLPPRANASTTLYAPDTRPTLLQRLFGKEKPKVGVPHRPEPKVARKPAEDAKKAVAKEEKPNPEAKVATEPARPTDWRQSWGKVERMEPPPPDKKKEKEKAVAQSSPAPKKKEPVSQAKPDPESYLPHSRKPTTGDPLTDPSPYRKRSPEEAGLKDKSSVATASAPKKETTVVAVKAKKTEAAPLPPAPASVEAAAQKPADKPPGSGSVFAAGDARFVPVPIVTVPPMRPQGPPPAQVPQAPQLNRTVNGGQLGDPDSGMGNAFTVVGPSKPIPSEQGSGGASANAFSAPEGSQAPPGPGSPMPPPAYAGATMPSHPAYGANPSLASGCPVPPQAYGAGLPAMPAQPGVPGIARIPVMPAQYVPAAYYPTAMPAMVGAMPAGQMMPPSGYYPPRAPVSSAIPSTVQVMQMLRDSDYPSQREWAADQLSDLNWRTYPQAVAVLVTAARTDPAPLVRVCCVRSLMKMQVNTVPVVSAVQELKSDTDPRVRDAVSEALVSFGLTPAPGTASIQAVSAPDSKGAH